MTCAVRRRHPLRLQLQLLDLPWRATLRRYFEKVRAGLKSDGVFMLDAFGGYAPTGS